MRKIGGIIFLLTFTSTVFACNWCKDQKSLAKEYFEKYYPKAAVITEEYFADMCPEAVDKSLKEFVELLSQNTWFYFRNKPIKFKHSEHWENITEQCKIISVFLNKSGVEDKLRAMGKTSYCDFLAMYCDYLVRMFNEGIRFNNLDKAEQHSFRLEDIAGRLGRTYSSYNDVVNRCRELISLLKKRLSLNF